MSERKRQKKYVKDEPQKLSGLALTKHKQRLRSARMDVRPDQHLVEVKLEQAKRRAENREKRRKQNKKQDEDHPQSKLEEFING